MSEEQKDEEAKGETRQRAERSDRGQPRLTRRDLEALAWLEEMRAVYETDLAVLLGRLAGRDPLSKSATWSAVGRWEKLGLARARKYLADEPRFVWLTLDGARLVANAQGWKEPGWGILRHTALVARTRLHVERSEQRKGTPIQEWISERRWRQSHTDAVRAGAHVPDAVIVEHDGSRTGVEVELSDKGPARALRIASELAGTYPRVLYVVQQGTQTARTAKAAADEALQRQARRGAQLGTFQTLQLPEEVER